MFMFRLASKSSRVCIASVNDSVSRPAYGCVQAGFELVDGWCQMVAETQGKGCFFHSPIVRYFFARVAVSYYYRILFYLRAGRKILTEAMEDASNTFHRVILIHKALSRHRIE